MTIVTITIIGLSVAGAFVAFIANRLKDQALDFFKTLSLASQESTASPDHKVRECGRAEIMSHAGRSLTSRNPYIRANETRHIIEQLADHSCSVAETLGDLTNDEGFEWLAGIHELTRPRSTAGAGPARSPVLMPSPPKTVRSMR